MKRIMMTSAGKRMLCVFLALSLLSAAFPLSAFAENTPAGSSVTRVGTYHYMSNEGTGIKNIYTEDTFLYNDRWFLSDGREFNRHLATLSSIASVASAGYYTENSADFSEHDKNVREFLGEMKFEDIESNTYYHLESFQNSASCIIGHKTVGSGKNAKTLLVILPMSANYGQEWNGNFTVDESGLHSGFKAARDECLRFFKQYITKHHITGDVKLWTTGHSRGAAVANLIGSFFAMGCGEYFNGCDITVSQENLYNYTFATPGTVTDHNVTSAHILSVGGSRPDYPNDTPGSEYVYSGADAGVEVDPHADRFSVVHNCRPTYDLITLLPPYQWGFTVFGSSFEITDGKDSTKKLMTAWMKNADIDVYNAYIDENKLAELINTGSHGDADEYAWKKFDLSSLSFTDDGELTMSDMMAQRVEGLTALTHNREYYTENYQETFRAIFGIYGLADKEVSDSLNITSELGTVMINYLAYASERMDGNDAAAAVEVITGLYRYLTGREIDVQSVTFKEVTKKFASLVNDSFVLKLLIKGALPENIKKAVCDAMGIELKNFSSGIDTLLTNLCSDNEAMSTAGFDALCKVIIKLLGDEKDYSAVFDVLGKTDGGVYTGDGNFVNVVAALMDVMLRDETGNRIPLSQKADELLSAMAEKVGAATVAKIKAKGCSEKIASDLEGYFSTIANNPAKTRQTLFYVLAYTDGDQPYNFVKELRTVITFITQANKIRFAHYNEVYIAWMRSQDSAYNLSLGDADEDETVSVLDVTAIQRALSNLPVTALNEMTADVDRDNEVTILDATYIQRSLVELSCPDGIGKPVIEAVK